MPQLNRELRVLILDDSEADAELIKRELTKSALALVSRWADSKEAFFREFDEFRPDLILCDYTIPSYSGLEALEFVRRRDQELAFIFVSGTVGEERAIEALRVGATDYVMKDHLARLVSAVQRARHELNSRLERDRLKAEAAEASRKLEEQRVQAVYAGRLRSLGEMAAGIAHELNQPLLGIRGLAEHLLIGAERGWNFSDEKIRTKVQMIVDQTDRMTYIVEHVRTFARGGRGGEDMPVQVNKVVQNSLALMGTQIKSRGIRLDCDFGDGLPQVLGNSFSLEEVVVNLVNNARDALEENIGRGLQSDPAVIKVRTCHEPGPDGGRVKIEVSDNGPGFPPEVQGKIFEPFFTTKPPQKGTGLGLAISRSIVEKFHGAIDLAPGPERGAVATVSLPIFRPEDK
jgi:two-component system, NtrC family, sensor kinase